MLIVCPACASEYEIPTDRVGPAGRQVRCAACRETWFIKPEDGASAGLPTLITAAIENGAGEGAVPAPAEGLLIDQPAPYPQQQSLPSPRGPRASAAGKGAGKRVGQTSGAWLRPPAPALAAGLALVVILPLAVLGRASIVSAMPQTAALYGRIGLPVNLRGIEIRDVAAFQNPMQGEKPGELVVEGDLVGVGRARVEVPDLDVAVQDDRGQTLYRWTVQAPRPALETAETARFRASLSAPPSAGRSVQVRFVARGATPPAADAHGATKETEH